MLPGATASKRCPPNLPLTSRRSVSGHFEATLNAPRWSLEASKQIFIGSGSLQKPFKRPSATIVQPSCNSTQFFVDFELPKVTPGPQTPSSRFRHFQLESPFGLKCLTLLVPILGAFRPPISLKTVLGPVLDRPRAVQEHFFSAPEDSKSDPQPPAPPEPTKPLQSLQEVSKRLPRDLQSPVCRYVFTILDQFEAMLAPCLEPFLA